MVALFIISAALLVIGTVTAGSAADDIVAGTALVIAIVSFGLFVVSATALITGSDNARAEKNKSICSQIPTAQWISDNNTCIKDGKVILP